MVFYTSLSAYFGLASTCLCTIFKAEERTAAGPNEKAAK